MKRKNSDLVEKKLREFLERTKELPEAAAQNNYDGDACYEALYHMRIMSRALEAEDINLAVILINWMTENKEKFRFCATDDDFEAVTLGIETRLCQITEEGFTVEKSNGLDLERYLSDLEMSEASDLEMSEALEKQIKKNLIDGRS